MKVWIDAVDKDILGLGGKSLFCCRLGLALRQLGVYVTHDITESVDIGMNVVRLKGVNSNAKKQVLRLDGIYHNTAQNFTKKNLGIKRSLEECDGVVYQSKHSKRLCDTFIGKAAVPSAIIYNGADATFYKKVETATDVPQSFVVMTHAKWRGHKRLRDMIESFLTANIKDSVLLIAGNISKCGIEDKQWKRYLEMSSIRYLGILNQKDLTRYLRRCDVSLHLCWLDACPNSMVEALVAGVPVISNNIGGGAELVALAGLQDGICEIDDEWDYKPCNLYNPPAINYHTVAAKLWKWKLSPPKVNTAPFHIERAAQEYLTFLESLL